MRKLLRYPEGELALRVVATDEHGKSGPDAFADWIMSLMDLAARTIGSARAKARVVTASVANLKVLQSPQPGDVVCVYTDIIRVGNTSITVGVRTCALRSYLQERIPLTAADYVVVAVDEDGLPRTLPVAA